MLHPSIRGLDRVPKEILLHIFDFLRLEDAVHLASTSKQYCNDHGIWVTILAQLWHSFGTVFSRESLEALSVVDLKQLISLPRTLELSTSNHPSFVSPRTTAKTSFSVDLGIILAESAPTSGRWLFTVSVPNRKNDSEAVLSSWDILSLIWHPEQSLPLVSRFVIPHSIGTQGAAIASQGSHNAIVIVVLTQDQTFGGNIAIVLSFSSIPGSATPTFKTLNTVRLRSRGIFLFQNPYVVFGHDTIDRCFLVWKWIADEWAVVTDAPNAARQMPILIDEEGLLMASSSSPPVLLCLEPFQTERMTSNDADLLQPRKLRLKYTVNGSSLSGGSITATRLAWEAPTAFSTRPRAFFFSIGFPSGSGRGGLVKGPEVGPSFDIPTGLYGIITPRCRTINGLTVATTVRWPATHDPDAERSVLMFIDERPQGKSWVYDLLDRATNWWVCPVSGVILRIESGQLVWQRPGGVLAG